MGGETISSICPSPPRTRDSVKSKMTVISRFDCNILSHIFLFKMKRIPSMYVVSKNALTLLLV